MLNFVYLLKEPVLTFLDSLYYFFVSMSLTSLFLAIYWVCICYVLVFHLFEAVSFDSVSETAFQTNMLPLIFLALAYLWGAGITDTRYHIQLFYVGSRDQTQAARQVLFLAKVSCQPLFIFWWCQGWNPWPWTYCASALSLSFIQSP